MTMSIPSQFAALLADRSQGGPKPDLRGLPEAQVMRLREAAARAKEGNPFRAGDLVMPRPDASVACDGNPHLVLETIAPVMPSFRTGACCSEKRLDMRTAYINRGGDIATHWAESWEWETWREPGAGTMGVAETPADSGLSDDPARSVA